MSDFTLAFKSTIDKLGFDLATTESIEFIDMDDLAKTAELFSNNKDAIVWEFLTLDENPSDPLYTFAFRMGARTVRDIANYNVLRLVDLIKTIFPTRTNVPIKNMSGAAAGPQVGSLYIVDVGVDPQQYDKESGIRMILVTGRCVRSG